MQARLWIRDSDREVFAAEGKQEGEVLDLQGLVGGDNVFFAATGITAGELLDGVRFLGDARCHTQSVVMRSYSGTIRWVEAEHDLDNPPPEAALCRVGTTEIPPEDRGDRRIWQGVIRRK